jgi:two-component system, cell cycle sensor histidine kinase and response regulator CckA
MLDATPTSANQLRTNLRLDPCDKPSAGLATILVVEDEAFVREAACDLLEREGYRVLRAGNATEAQAAFHRHPGSVRLLLSDVVLPGQNGFALLKDLQLNQPALKAIFISGYPENTVTRYGLGTAQVSYLPKPFSAESLLGTIRQVLEVAEE